MAPGSAISWAASALGGATAPGGGNAAGNANPQTQQPGQNNLLGGPLGEAIGNLIQQGLSGGAGTPGPTGTATGRSRSLPADAIHPDAASLARALRPRRTRRWRSRTASR